MDAMTISTRLGVDHLVEGSLRRQVNKLKISVQLIEGVSLSKGIPVAVFFDAEGKTIGTTNEGELEPARLYSSRQILKFARDVAERSRIQAPNAVP